MTALEQTLNRLQGRRIAVIGAGVSNMPLVVRLRGAGLPVTVYDRKEPEALPHYDALAALGTSFSLGETYLDRLMEDFVFRTPGMHPAHPALEEVRARGGIVTSEMELFFAVCPCPIIGITGSDGKTTTTTLVYEFLTQAGYTCHLGGNIGTPLLSMAEEMEPGHLAVVELSSFQLMGMERSPSIAAITNLTPNHLDYHKDFDEYVGAKTAIYAHQEPGARLVLNLDDAVTMGLSLPEDREIWGCTKKNVPQTGIYLKDGVIYIAQEGVSRPLMHTDHIRMPGAHNVSNVMMAAAIVQGYCNDRDLVQVAQSFAGVAHRIEFVRELDGVRYYNDSIASTPTRTIAGLQAFDRKVILIAGGYDKQIPYDALGQPICNHVSRLILTGATGAKIRAAVERADCDKKPDMIECASLADAVQAAHGAAQDGDIVLLSPASASFDCFEDFVQRGEHFRQLVHAL